MKLVCPTCGSTIAGADIDLGRGVGVCRPCSELVPIPDVAAPLVTAFRPQALDLPASPEERRLYKPESLSMVEEADGETYRATLPPRRLRALPMLGFALMWNTFMAVWYGIALSQGVWLMAVFGLLHLAVGIGVGYGALLGLFNTRRFVIANGDVSFRSGPIPARGNVEVRVDAVDGFAVHTKATSKSTSFCVAMNLADGRMHELDVGADDRPAAEYAAACFQEALRNAKRMKGDGPYRA